jgi:hypothetical protein
MVRQETCSSLLDSPSLRCSAMCSPASVMCQIALSHPVYGPSGKAKPPFQPRNNYLTRSGSGSQSYPIFCVHIVSLPASPDHFIPINRHPLPFSPAQSVIAFGCAFTLLRALQQPEQFLTGLTILIPPSSSCLPCPLLLYP